MRDHSKRTHGTVDTHGTAVSGRGVAPGKHRHAAWHLPEKVVAGTKIALKFWARCADKTPNKENHMNPKILQWYLMYRRAGAYAHEALRISREMYAGLQANIAKRCKCDACIDRELGHP